MTKSFYDTPPPASHLVLTSHHTVSGVFPADGVLVLLLSSLVLVGWLLGWSVFHYVKHIGENGISL